MLSPTASLFSTTDSMISPILSMQTCCGFRQAPAATVCRMDLERPAREAVTGTEARGVENPNRGVGSGEWKWKGADGYKDHLKERSTQFSD